MIVYRKASGDDMEELIRLRLEFLRELRDTNSANQDAALAHSLRGYLQDALANESFVAWLALDGGKIVGTSGLSFYTVPPSNQNLTGRVAYIMNMYTVPDFRRRGIAAELFARILEEAGNRSYRKICLHATEKGRPIYARFGFTDTHEEMVLFLD